MILFIDDGGGGGVAALYWRLNISLTETADNFYAQIAELQMRTTAGGSNVATGGTASAGSSFVSTPPSDAFDGNTATSWVSDNLVVPASGLIWLAYQFASAVDIAEVVITSGDSGARALRAPVDFTVQKSDDGASWSTVWSVTGSTAWGITETRVFTKP